LFAFLLTAALAGMAGTASAANPLVDVNWVKANIGKSNVVFLDVRGEGRADYIRAHIPGAIYSDYAKDGWRVKDKHGTPAMLPETPAVEKLIGGLGIDNKNHVVIVSSGTNALDMGTATRVYWTFKAMGHDEVSILNGGWQAYAVIDEKTKQPVNPVEAGNIVPKAKTFKANVRTDMIPTKDDVKKALDAKTTVIDHRPSDFYLGVTQHPLTKRAGTIPGAKSLPEAWITENNGGKIRDKASLEKLYAAAGVPTSGDQINFCNTGHWASLGWFASHEILGNKKAKMYDGSMVEWANDPNLPVEAKINVAK
jgi:thiosulfate/3-mercaptopyruvate sulfurtransferase